MSKRKTQEDKEDKKDKKDPIKVLEINLINNKVTSDDKISTSKLLGANTLKPLGSKNKISSDELFLKSASKSFHQKVEVLSFDEDTYLKSPLFDNETAAWGSGAGTFARIKDYILLKKIYDYVDGFLFFPSFLYRNNIQGVSNARLVLNFEGHCDWGKTQIYGDSNHIKLYVLYVLKNVCRQSFKSFIKNRIQTNVDLSFQFALTENSDNKIADKNKFIVGNTLFFYRSSLKSITEWEFGPFKGVFPLPAVYLNIPWIQENWDKVISNKSPLSEFKKEFGG